VSGYEEQPEWALRHGRVSFSRLSPPPRMTETVLEVTASRARSIARYARKTVARGWAHPSGFLPGLMRGDGLYGHFPQEFLRAVVPPDVFRTTGWRLTSGEVWRPGKPPTSEDLPPPSARWSEFCPDCPGRVSSETRYGLCLVHFRQRRSNDTLPPRLR
jgi:hypothetical protein